MKFPSAVLSLGVVAGFFSACGEKDERTDSLSLGGPSGAFGGADGQGGNTSLGGSMGGLDNAPPAGPGMGCENLTCGANAECIETMNGSASCQCKAGFGGTDCSDTAQCPVSASEPNPCGDNSDCLDGYGITACPCQAGFKKTGGACEDVDECTKGSHGCTEGTCTDTEGSYACSCKTGHGDGIFCKVTDDCAGDPCGPGTCANTPHGFVCTCPAGASGAACSDTTSCDDIAFSDDNLRAAVLTLLGREDGTIAASDLTPFTEADLSAKEITSLEGMECWPGLEHLDLSFNGVTDLSPLSFMGSLRTLNLDCTTVDSLAPLGSLVELEALSFQFDFLCSTDPTLSSFAGLEDLTGLRNLRLSGTEVSNLEPLAGLTRLQLLSAGSNGVSGVDALSAMTDLTHLDLRDNALTSLAGLAGLTTVEHLDVRYNELSDLSPLSSLARLRTIALAGNDGVSDLSPLESMTNLADIDLGNMGLTAASDLAGLRGFISLNLTSNEISNLGPLVEAENFASAGTLILSDNPLLCLSQKPLITQLEQRGLRVEGVCQ